MTITQRTTLRALCIAAGLTTACSYSYDSTSPTLPDPAGAYTATDFTITLADSTVDELAEGVSITITLSSNGETTGALQVPGVGSTTLDGTFSQTGDVIRFNHAPPTLLTTIPFRLVGDRLEGDGMAGAGVAHIRLQRHVVAAGC